MVTQTGAYFSFASLLPLLGSSAKAALAREHAAAAAAAKIKSLLPLLLLLSSFFVSPSGALAAALATTRLRRLEVEGLAMVEAEPAVRNEAAVMVMDAISANVVIL